MTVHTYKAPHETIPMLIIKSIHGESPVDTAVRCFHDEHLALYVVDTEVSDDTGDLIIYATEREAVGCCVKHRAFFN